MSRKMKVLSMFLAFVITTFLFTSSVYADTSNTTVTGTIQPTIITFTISLSVSFTINPNGATPATRFIAPNIAVQNGCNAPIKVEVSNFVSAGGSPHVFTDVLPAEFTNWDNLGRTDSEGKIALALKATTPAEWKNLVSATNVYAKTIQLGTPILIGEVDPATTAHLTLDASHGLTFGSTLTSTYLVTWLISLA